MSSTAGNARRSLWRLLAIVAGVVLLLWLAWQWLPVVDWSQALIKYISDLGIWGPVIYWVIYVLASIVGIPRTPLNVGAGIIFSYPVALAVVLVSAVTAFTATFQIARRFGSEWIQRKIDRISTAKKIKQLVEEECFKFVFLARINPFVPAVIKGYGFGTTSIPFRTYLLASVLGFLPIACAHVYLGWLGGYAMMHSGEQPEEWKMGMLIGGAIVSVILVVVVSWYGHRAMKKYSD